MSNIDAIEEIERQIEKFEKTGLTGPVCNEISSLINTLGGKLKVEGGETVDATLCYILLLMMRKLKEESPD